MPERLLTEAVETTVSAERGDSMEDTSGGPEVYQRDDVLAATTAYFGGDALAADVWCSKYALCSADGRLLEKTPDDMHRRLAREFARIEARYPGPLSEDDIYALLSSWRVVPQGSPMSAIGNPYRIQSLSNCFVIEAPHDSYGGILKTDEEEVQIMKRRGGVGFDISTLRPKGMPTANAAGTTDGIGVFMERFSRSCREVAQGGRRGALLLSLSVEHIEVETFIDIKRDLERVTGANVSLRVTDEFMRAVSDDGEFVLRWPCGVTQADAKVTKTVRARDIWDRIIDAAWTSAEPGVMFWDTVLRESCADVFADEGFKTVSANPCGELVLSAYDSCRLMLLDLTRFVVEPFTPDARFDADEFGRVGGTAQRLMDDLVDLELEAVDRIIAKVSSSDEREDVKAREFRLWTRIRETCADARRTGLGITGLGDAMAMCGIVYGSPRSIEFTDDVYRTLAVAAHTESVKMARERGPFLACEPSRYLASHPFFDRLRPHVDPETWKSFVEHGRRNIALTTTAPAGSVSLLTQTTSGIEPVFRLGYTRRRKATAADGDKPHDFVDASGDAWYEYDVLHHGLSRWMSVTGKTDVTESPYHGATSADIDPMTSVELQAAAQRWIEHSISKTINVPAETTRETVSELYFRAWQSGCKGVTVYRDGCRSGVLVAAKAPDTRIESVIESHAPKRPPSLTCDIHRATVKGEGYLVIVGLLDGRPYEVFAGLSQCVDVPKKAKQGELVKNGRVDGTTAYNLRIPLGDDDELVLKNVVQLFDNPLHGALTRTMSLSLRHGVPVKYLVEQLRKDRHSDLQSFSSVIARVLAKHYIDDGSAVTGDTCQSCGSRDLRYVEGCVTCGGCGSSRCG